MAVQISATAAHTLHSRRRLLAVILARFLVLTLLIATGRNLWRGYQRTALFQAAEQGDTARVEALLAQGVDPDCRRSAGYGLANRESPLLVATRSGRWPAVRLLLAAGADPGVHNETVHSFAKAVSRL